MLSDFKKNVVDILFPGRELSKVYYLFALMLIVGILEVFGLASIAPFLGIVTEPELINRHSLIHSLYATLEFSEPKHLIAFLGAVFLVVMVMTSVLNIFLGWQINIFVQNTTARLSQALLRCYFSKSYSFFLETHSSIISKNVLSEVPRAVERVIYPFLIALSKISLSAFISALLLLVDPVLAFICFSTFSIYYLLVFRYFKKQVDAFGNAVAQAIALRFKIVSESIGGIREIKLESKEEEYISLFKQPSERFADLIVSSQLRATLPKAIIEALSYSLITLVIIYLSVNVPNSGARVSLIALYGFSAYRLIPAIHLAYENLVEVRFNFTALITLSKQLQEARREIDSKHHKNEVDVERNHTEIDASNVIRFTSVSYSYPTAQTKALDNVCLEFSPGTHIGLVGESGSGKSTLINILLGLLDRSSGEITVGNVELYPNNFGCWQGQIAYVPQSIFLFDGSIAQNISFELNSKSVDKERLSNVIYMSSLAEFVNSLPHGENTLIGEDGVKLSGGQKQRIGVARALYRRSKLIILDEATSSIDAVNELKVTNHIEALKHQPTIITVTHRLAILKNCSIIYTMKKGKIMSSGSYEDLIDNCQYFRSLITSAKI